jgi:phosphoribosylformimino-5-aminoimidazole carboxamide ribonucleotide (ProFAR) isomerase
LSYIRRDTADGADDGILAICGGGDRGTTRGAYINLYGADAPGGGGSFIDVLGTKHRHYVGTDYKLEITGGAVKAASGASTNLKQVARVHFNSFTLTTAETFEVITHNLGTSNIVVSVRTDPGNGVGEIVEVAVNTGDENNATVTNKCTLRFASAPAANTGYVVTVIG